MVERSTALFMESAHVKDPHEQYLIDYKLYMLRFGYLTEKEPMAAHIKYNKNTRDHFHPFAGKAVGELFGFREYEKYMPILDYLEMPVNITEDLLEGIGQGQKRLNELKENAARQAKNRLANSPDTVLKDAIERGSKHVK